MKLLGHPSPEMTMLYAEFTQTDLQREFRAARSQPRHLSRRRKPPLASLLADLPSTLHALQVAQHVLEMFRRTLSDTDSDSRLYSIAWPTASPKSLAELRKLASQIGAGRDWPDKRRSVYLTLASVVGLAESRPA